MASLLADALKCGVKLLMDFNMQISMIRAFIWSGAAHCFVSDYWCTYCVSRQRVLVEEMVKNVIYSVFLFYRS